MSGSIKVKLELLAANFKVMYPKNEYVIRNVYLDYDANMMWNTIICVRKGNEDDTYQMLVPRDMKALEQMNDVVDVAWLAREIANEQRNLLR